MKELHNIGKNGGLNKKPAIEVQNQPLGFFFSYFGWFFRINLLQRHFGRRSLSNMTSTAWGIKDKPHKTISKITHQQSRLRRLINPSICKITKVIFWILYSVRGCAVGMCHLRNPNLSDFLVAQNHVTFSTKINESPSFNRYRRKRPKVDASISDAALSHTWLILVTRTRRKKRRKYSCPLLDVFACGQVSSPRLYRLK